MTKVFQEKEKLREKEQKLKEKEAEAKDRELRDRKPNIYSRKMSRIVETKMSGSKDPKRSLANVIKSRRVSLPDLSEKSSDMTEEEKEKKKVMETIIAELKDPNRDYNNFDPGEWSVSGMLYNVQLETDSSNKTGYCLII